MENYQQQGAQYQQPYQQAYDQQGQQPYTPVPEAPAMGFADAVKSCFSNYATFTGRATRAEFCIELCARRPRGQSGSHHE